jgi:hypothetical protein
VTRFHRSAHRQDRDHAAIVKALRQCGCAVLDISSVGRDCPDLLVCRRGVSVLMEVKSSDGKLSDGQRKFLADWPGPSVVVFGLDEAIRWAVSRP